MKIGKHSGKNAVVDRKAATADNNIIIVLDRLSKARVLMNEIIANTEIPPEVIRLCIDYIL